MIHEGGFLARVLGTRLVGRTDDHYEAPPTEHVPEALLWRKEVPLKITVFT
jgi:hypothetical protein